jgi:hypothetical protein
MTDQEQIRRAAVYSGIMGTSGTQVPIHKLVAFAQMLLDEENEACAQICDDWANGWNGEPEMSEMADEIRARRKA